MKSDILREKFINFFKQKNHKEYDSSSLIPKQEDESVLFTSAGMQQFKDWYINRDLIKDSRVATVQKCFRTSDIEEVGDGSHHTFFEMLGNFSFGYPKVEGSYFKKEAIKLAWQFLTADEWLGISKDKISATIFKGDEQVPKDKDSKKVLESLGVEDIKELGREENFWGPVGKTGPCGPTVEFFVPGEKESVEIWNLVFNQYFKETDGKLKKLDHQGVDTGMGLERVAAYLQGVEDDYQTDLFSPLMKIIANKVDIEKYSQEARVIVDHLRGAIFLIDEGVRPSNLKEGYILRRVLRRVFVRTRILSLDSQFGLKEIYEISKKILKLNFFWQIDMKWGEIKQIIDDEYKRWVQAIDEGTVEFEKIIAGGVSNISGQEAFRLHDTYGLPKEIIKSLFSREGIEFKEDQYRQAEKEHKKISKKGAQKKFKGGLADKKDETVKLHTAAHLLMESLIKVLGEDVKQAGQNITQERLRFDFTYSNKLTDKQLEEIEKMVNKQIDKGLDVKSEEMKLEEAIDQGAMAFFKDRYPDEVTVYTIGHFSKEICLGPHIDNTSQLGEFEIIKEESSSKGVRRIRGVLK